MGIFKKFGKSKKEITITQKPIQKFRKDKAEWQWDTALEHYCGQFNKKADSLSDEEEIIIWEYAGNHIAFFLTWLLRHDYMSETHYSELKDDIEAVKSKRMTGMEYLSVHCDMVLYREDIAEKILPFVDMYYDSSYLSDYCDYMQDGMLSTVFSWEDYERFETTLDQAVKDYV